jgi:hypothetical protein
LGATTKTGDKTMIAFFIFAALWINGWFFLLAWAFGMFDSLEERDRKYVERRDRRFEKFKQENTKQLRERIKKERELHHERRANSNIN